MIDQLTDGNGQTLRIAVDRIGKSQTYNVKVFIAGPQGKNRLAYTNQARIASRPVRLKIIKELCEKFRTDTNLVESCLLDQLAHAEDFNATADTAESTLRINPSGHFDPSLAAIAVPRQTGSSAQWVLCVQHQGGLREIIPITSPNISLEDGSRILVHPLPNGDGDGDRSAWSAERRAAWAEGASPPDPFGLVTELAQEIDRYIRFPGNVETHETWCLTIAVFAAFSHVYRASLEIGVQNGPGAGENRR